MNPADALMRAMALHDFAGPDRFQVEHRPRPAPGPTEVLVAVTATGINPVEWGASAGGWLAMLHGGPPLYLGWDVAGRVVEVGYGVTRLKPGDDVFGMPRFPQPAGSYGEYVTAPSRHFALKPAGISHIEAAGLPLVGLTAWQALVDTAAVRPGHRVLVTATTADLLELPGVGVETAAQLLTTAGDNPDRLRSEAAFAHLCGAAPIPVSSGRTDRHRLNRGGDRLANSALYTIALTRMRWHETRPHLRDPPTPARPIHQRNHAVPQTAHRPLDLLRHPSARTRQAGT